jgi:hypothetical protein
MTPIGIYRFNRGKGSRALIEAQLVDETCVVGVTEPL